APRPRRLRRAGPRGGPGAGGGALRRRPGLGRRVDRMKTRIAIATLGCRVNFFDTQLVEEGLDPARFRQVGFDEDAEIYVVNTCTVTANADAQARNLIRRAKRRNATAAVVVTGCYAATRAAEL